MRFLKAHWKKILYIFLPIVIAICLIQYLNPNYIQFVLSRIKDKTKKLPENNRKEKAPDVNVTDIETEFTPDAIDNAKAWAIYDKFKKYLKKP